MAAPNDPIIYSLNLSKWYNIFKEWVRKWLVD